MICGVIGEDSADAACLDIIIRKIGEHSSIPISKVFRKGYSGWGQMLDKALGQIITFADQGCDVLIVCWDADGVSGRVRIRVSGHEVLRRGPHS
jgi:hypothetical protein